MPGTSTNSRIAIVDDDAIVRDYLIDIVTSASELDLAGVAPNLAKARELLALEPDLFLVDIGLPDGSGLDFVPEAKAHGQAKVLVLTSFGDRETVVTAIRSGADGYLLKDSTEATILDGIRVTLEGGAPVSSAAAVYMLEQLRSAPMVVAAEEENSGLTPREVEVFDLVAEGMTSQSIATQLGISARTVESYRAQLMEKLQLDSVASIVRLAVKLGRVTA